MADEDQPPAQPNPTPPATQAAQVATQAGASEAEAHAAAAQAARETRPELSEAEVNKIADGVMDRMEKRGLFDVPEPEPETAANPTPDGAASPATPSANGDGDNVPGEKPPEKRSLAARFMGMK